MRLEYDLSSLRKRDTATTLSEEGRAHVALEALHLKADCRRCAAKPRTGFAVPSLLVCNHERAKGVEVQVGQHDR